MKKIMNSLFGIITIIPFLYGILFLFFILFRISEHRNINYIFEILHICIMILTFILLFIYMFLILNNKKIKGNKILWLIALLWGNIITMPIYWYIHILKRNNPR